MRKIGYVLLAVSVVLYGLGCGASSEVLLYQPSEHLPYGAPGRVDHVGMREGYAVGLSCRNRIALWVSYRLTKTKVQNKIAERSNRFREDTEFPCCSVKPGEYKGAGFDRGHLAPAGDMSFSIKAMEESFLMSNIAPQKPGFNRGIWKNLEAQVRHWAETEEEIIMVTGAILPKEITLTVGPGRIPVPEAFFKLVYDLTPPQKMIAFIIPNKSSKQKLQDFAITVDAVENATSFDFFPHLEQSIQQMLESKIDVTQWQWR